MKRIYNKRSGYRLNNRGFSLVELLISIAVLVIIMVPLMGNFIRSMQINKKSERYQIQSNHRQYHGGLKGFYHQRDY